MGWGENDRGVSFTFGAEVVAKFLHKLDFDLICRAHQVVWESSIFVNLKKIIQTLPGRDLSIHPFFGSIVIIMFFWNQDSKSVTWLIYPTCKKEQFSHCALTRYELFRRIINSKRFLHIPYIFQLFLHLLQVFYNLTSSCLCDQFLFPNIPLIFVEAKCTFGR